MSASWRTPTSGTDRPGGSLLSPRLVAALGLQIAAAGLALTLLAHAAPDLPSPARRVPAMDFVLPRAEGGTLRLSSLRGKPVVMTFWAFWCNTWHEVCRGYRELSRSGTPAQFVVVAVDATRSELLHDPEQGFDRWFPILVDRERRVSQAYHIDCVPTVYVLDARGRICYRARGWPGTAAVQNAVRQALRE